MFGTPLGSAEPSTNLKWGVTAGLRVPLQSDLQVTTGSWFDPLVGVFADWQTRPGEMLRADFGAGWFAGATRVHSDPYLQQALSTRVRDEAVGAAYLWRPARFGGAWELGAGLYLIRWSVASTNQLTMPGGTFGPSGTSTWTREGLGLLVGRRWNPHLETEAKIQFSHFGYENQPTRLASFNVLWHF